MALGTVVSSWSVSASHTKPSLLGKCWKTMQISGEEKQTYLQIHSVILYWITLPHISCSNWRFFAIGKVQSVKVRWVGKRNSFTVSLRHLGQVQ